VDLGLASTGTLLLGKTMLQSQRFNKIIRLRAFMALLLFASMLPGLLGLGGCSSSDSNSSGVEPAGKAPMLIAETAPDAPTSVNQVYPATDIGRTASLTLQVNGVQIGDKVRVYKDPSCTSLAATATARSTTVSLSVGPLSTDGLYQFYANATDAWGNVSECSNPSTPYQLDRKAPSPASGLAWSQTSPTAAKPLKATWDPSTASDLMEQRFEIFATADCSGSAAKQEVFKSVGPPSRTQSFDFSWTNPGPYSYKITSLDAASNSSVSACSPSVTVDNSIVEISGLTHDTTPTRSKTWSWRCSQTNCTYWVLIDQNAVTDPTLSASTVFVTEASATQSTGNGTYYIHVVAKDALGNLSSVVHASAMLDNSPPAKASNLGWQQASPSGSPSGSTSGTAEWTKSGSNDLRTQRIQFYSNPSCSAPTGSPIDLDANTGTQAFTGASGGIYSYKITSMDAAGNSAVSDCSSPIAMTAAGFVLVETTETNGTFVSPAKTFELRSSADPNTSTSSMVIVGSWSVTLDFSIGSPQATFENNWSTDYGGRGFLLLDTTSGSSGSCDYSVGTKVIVNENGLEVSQGDGFGGFFVNDYNHIWTEGSHSLTLTASTSAPYLTASVDSSPLTLAHTSRGNGSFNGFPVLLQNGNWIVSGGGFAGSRLECGSEQIDWNVTPSRVSLATP